MNFHVKASSSKPLDVATSTCRSIGRMMAPQGFWGSGENDYLYSGSRGALVIILGDIGRKLIVLGI